MQRALSVEGGISYFSVSPHRKEKGNNFYFQCNHQLLLGTPINNLKAYHSLVKYIRVAFVRQSKGIFAVNCLSNRLPIKTVVSDYLFNVVKYLL